MTTPSQADVRQTVLRLLGEIAPEADLALLRPDRNVREQLDLDSMDFLNFIVALHKQFGIEIPESAYPELTTIDGCVTFIRNKLAQP